MGYLNPLEAYTYQRVAQDAANVGVDGFLIVDSSARRSRHFSETIATT